MALFTDGSPPLRRSTSLSSVIQTPFRPNLNPNTVYSPYSSSISPLLSPTYFNPYSATSQTSSIASPFQQSNPPSYFSSRPASAQGSSFSPISSALNGNPLMANPALRQLLKDILDRRLGAQAFAQLPRQPMAGFLAYSGFSPTNRKRKRTA